MTTRLKIIIIFSCIIIAGSGIWGLLYSVKQKLDARETRRQKILEQKAPETKATIIEGLTNTETYASLEKQGVGKNVLYEKAESTIDRKKYSFLVDNPNKSTLQGFLFPDTYKFSTNSTETSVLQKLLDAFGRKWEAATAGIPQKTGYFLLPGYESVNLKNRQGNGLTPYEIVTLASIIEKETGRIGEPATSERLLTERRTVAGIFLNRLLIGQALQSDATLNYITKSGRASASAVDLEIDSPYNTYKYPGLPPGPIANVSYSSLYAALHPIKTDYYYFLHSQTSGEIYYAKTYEDQLKNKARYLK